MNGIICTATHVVSFRLFPDYGAHISTTHLSKYKYFYLCIIPHSKDKDLNFYFYLNPSLNDIVLVPGSVSLDLSFSSNVLTSNAFNMQAYMISYTKHVNLK
jgi:hypothetical protein